MRVLALTVRDEEPEAPADKYSSNALTFIRVYLLFILSSGFYGSLLNRELTGLKASF